MPFSHAKLVHEELLSNNFWNMPMAKLFESVIVSIVDQLIFIHSHILDFEFFRLDHFNIVTCRNNFASATLLSFTAHTVCCFRSRYCCRQSESLTQTIGIPAFHPGRLRIFFFSFFLVCKSFDFTLWVHSQKTAASQTILVICVERWF